MHEKYITIHDLFYFLFTNTTHRIFIIEHLGSATRDEPIAHVSVSIKYRYFIHLTHWKQGVFVET